MPVTEQGGCGTSAALSLGGSESDLRLDRLSARAKQAGADHQGRGSLSTPPDQKQVSAAPYNRVMPVSLGTDRLLASRTPRRPRGSASSATPRRSTASSATSPTAWPAHPRAPGLRRDLRPAARLPVRRAGKHDRDRARARRRCAACRSTRSTARRASRPPRCCATSTCSSSICRTSARASTPTSTRWPTAWWRRSKHGVKVIVCDRPNPIGGDAVEGPMLVHGLRVVRRPVSDADAPRHDDRRARAAVQRARSASAPISRSCRWRAGAASMYFDATGIAVGAAVAEHPDARLGDRLSGHGAVRRHERLRRARDDAGRSSCSARRGSDAERFADAMNALALPGVLFRPAVFEPTFHKHAQTSCGGCQIHVLDRAAFRPVEAGVALHRRVPRGRSRSLPLARSAVRVRARQAADRHPRRIVRRCASRSRRGVPARDIAASWEPAVSGFAKLRQKFLLY